MFLQQPGPNRSAVYCY